MSYEVELVKAEVFIAREHHKELLEKLKKKYPGMKEKVERQRGMLERLREPPILRANLAEELGYWCWHPILDEDYNIFGMKLMANFMDELFTDYLFKILSPRVRAGSEVIIRGEDSTLYKWVFDGKSVKRLESRAVVAQSRFKEVRR